jgi:hypothetical protein
MEELYRNPLLTIALSILALLMIGNSGIQLYMLNCPPILIEKDLTQADVGYEFTGAAGYSLGPLIYLNPTTEPTRYRILRHEYQHYMQTALLSPIGFALCYWGDQFILGHDYHENWFEIDAQRAEKDFISFKVFDWNLKKFIEINPP